MPSATTGSNIPRSAKYLNPYKTKTLAQSICGAGAFQLPKCSTGARHSEQTDCCPAPMRLKCT
jgi:hypothetical protein